jgi:hypothetical protein
MVYELTAILHDFQFPKRINDREEFLLNQIKEADGE